MISINHTFEIEAKKETVWSTIVDLDAYGEWNEFVVKCRSSLLVGDQIVMNVRVLPFFAMKQTETILQHKQGELLEYGISLPLGLLGSSRKHIVTSLGDNLCRYESSFELRGLFSPIVKLMLEKQLQRGFTDMSEGVKSRALDLSEKISEKQGD